MVGTILRITAGLALLVAVAIFNLTGVTALCLYLAAYLIAGADVLYTAGRNILRGNMLDENFLMTIATIGAFLIGEYPEGVAVMLFYRVGELFQDYAVDKSRKSIAELMDIRPDYANILVDGEVVKTDPYDVGIGDTIVIKPGEKVPLDSRVISGYGAVDTSALTGESVPRDIGPSSEILAGFINAGGVLTAEVLKEFSDSTAGKILDLVENASANKSKSEHFITKFARYYTPGVVAAAVLMAVVPPLLISGATFAEWCYRALTFLVISCPCALVLSIPLSFFGGIGGASRNGILVKGGNYLETLAATEIIVLDKTGTLTKGVFNVQETVVRGDISADELLRLSAYTEYYSNHPIAESVRRAYSEEIDTARISDAREIAGHGVAATVDGRAVLAGNLKLMERENISLGVVGAANRTRAVLGTESEELTLGDDGTTSANRTENDGTDSADTVHGTVVHVAVDGQYAGFLLIADELKADAALAISLLRQENVKRMVMLTGDSKASGEKVARELGIIEVYTELLPEDKVTHVEELLSSSSGVLAFVGDGINDAPVLARADIGIAMGGLGSDAAIEAADIVIMTDEPSKIAAAIRLARKTLRIVRQNIVFALGVKVLTLILGAMGLAGMWQAVFADVGVCLIAVLNAMRALQVSKS